MNCPGCSHLRPRPGPTPQPVGSSAGMPQAKPPTWRDHRDEDEARYTRKTYTSASLTTLKLLTVDHNKLWKILQEMGIPDHVTCLLRNLYAGQEATVRTRHGTTDGFQIGNGVYVKAICCHCAYLTYMQSTSCEMPGWMKHKLQSRLPGEILVTSDMQMTPPLWQKAKRN